MVKNQDIETECEKTKYNININKTQPDKQVTMGRKPSQNKRRLMCAQNYL